jgi:hypothetical protein
MERQSLGLERSICSTVHEASANFYRSFGSWHKVFPRQEAGPVSTRAIPAPITTPALTIPRYVSFFPFAFLKTLADNRHTLSNPNFSNQ